MMVAIIVSLLINNACKKDHAQAVVAPVTPPTTVVDTCSSISFSKTILPIVTNYCAISGCHSAGSQTVLTNYSQLKAVVDNSHLTFSATAVLGTSLDMSARSGLSISQTNEFICWLKNGAPQN